MLAGLFSLLPVQQAEALEEPRWLYLDAAAGWDNTESIRLDSSDAKMTFDQGVFQPALAVGVQTPHAWRFELERVAHENTPEILYSSSAGIESDSDEADEFRSISLMLNVFRDFQVGEAFRPYLGAGLGRSRVHLHFSKPRFGYASVFIPRDDRIDDRDTALAFQLIAGFTVPVTRRFDIGLDYRYWSAPSLKFEEVTGADLDTQMNVHSAWFHVRYHATGAGLFGSSRPRASHPSGWYVAARAGGIFAEDAERKGTDNVIDSFKFGPVGSIAIGYALNQRWQFELAGSHQYNAIKVLEISGAIGEDRASGALNLSAVTLNAIRHFSLDSAIRPYFGVGLGMARAAYDIDARTFCQGFVCGPVEYRYTFVDDHANGFAAQAILGVEVAISPRLSFTADYRYWRAHGFDLESPTGQDIEINRQDSNSVMAGLRFRLGPVN